MSIDKLESNVVITMTDLMSKATTTDSLNKVYRHARIWSRYHFGFGLEDDEKRIQFNMLLKEWYTYYLKRLEE